MSAQAWLEGRLQEYQAALRWTAGVAASLSELAGLMRGAARAGRKVIFAGNGGSAAIASHCAVDFTKTAGLRCITFNEADLITCFANDYGYARWVERALGFYADAGDLVVLISSSGRSPNMVNAAVAAGRDLTVVTFTGFSADNPLRRLGRLNLWIDSTSYNLVEMTHHVWLLAVCDYLAQSPDSAPATAPAGEGRAGMTRSARRISLVAGGPLRRTARR